MSRRYRTAPRTGSFHGRMKAGVISALAEDSWERGRLPGSGARGARCRSSYVAAGSLGTRAEAAEGERSIWDGASAREARAHAPSSWVDGGPLEALVL